MNLIELIISTPNNLKTILGINNKNAFGVQKSILKKLLNTCKHTQFGVYHHFEKILNHPDLIHGFKKYIPITDYNGIKYWWQKAYNGEENVAWKGKIKYFAVSSGSTDAASKYIPVSNEMLKLIKKASLKQIIAIAKTDIPKDYLTKNYLALAGSTTLEYNGKGNTFSGDLSGITISKIPFWMERMSRPHSSVKAQKNWQQKIEKITEEAHLYDVGIIAGVPAWVQLLFENIIQKYKLKHIHEIWPNLSVYIHGGVSLEPYTNSLNNLLGKPIKYFETYLASEGFIAFQTNENSVGMKLNLKSEIFFEFIPWNEKNFDEEGNIKKNATTLLINEVKQNVEYALLITTCSGAWRYLIGDVVKFTDVEKCEIVITGRTKHFLSICGEHLSVGNMNMAITKVAEVLKTNFNEYTVKAYTENGEYGHQWYIACDDEHVKANQVKELLDSELKNLNDDYAVERANALKHMSVKLIPTTIFISWLDKHGKIGSQSKFPRVLPTKLYEDWMKFINN